MKPGFGAKNLLFYGLSSTVKTSSSMNCTVIPEFYINTFQSALQNNHQNTHHNTLQSHLFTLRECSPEKFAETCETRKYKNLNKFYNLVYKRQCAPNEYLENCSGEHNFIECSIVSSFQPQTSEYYSEKFITTTPLCKSYVCAGNSTILKQCMPKDCNTKMGILYFLQIVATIVAIVVNFLRLLIILRHAPKTQNSLKSHNSTVFRYTQVIPDILLSTITSSAAVYVTIVSNISETPRFNYFFTNSVGFFTVFSVSVKICSSALFVFNKSETQNWFTIFVLWIFPVILSFIPMISNIYQVQTNFSVVLPNLRSNITTGILCFWGGVVVLWGIINGLAAVRRNFKFSTRLSSSESLKIRSESLQFLSLL